MSRLWDDVPTIMNGPDTIRPVGPGPNIFSTLLGFANNAVSAIDRGNDVYNQRSQRQRQARLDARGEQDRSAENDAARGFATVVYGPNTTEAPVDPRQNLREVPAGGTGPFNEGFFTGNPLDDTARQAAQDLAPRLLVQQEAASQGRSNSPEMVRLRTEALIRQGLARHPGAEAAFVNELDKLGVTSIATQEYRRAEASIDADTARNREDESHIIDYAIEHLGLDYHNLSAPDQAQARQSALTAMRAETTLHQLDTRSQIDSRSASMTQQDLAQREELESHTRLQAVNDLVGVNLDQVTRSLTQIYNDPNVPEADRDRLTAEALRVLNTEGPRRFNQYMGLYGSRMSPSDRTAATDQFNRYMGALNGLLTGPASVVETNHRTLQILTDRLHINIQQALPLWQQMSAIVGPQTLGTLFQSNVLGLLTNPDGTPSDFGRTLTHELQSASYNGLTPGDARVRLTNILRMVGGDLSMADLSPQHARESAPGVLGSMSALARNTEAVSGTNLQSHLNLVHSIENASTVAVEANRQWGVGNLIAHVNVFTTTGVQQALAVTTANREERTRAIPAYQVGLNDLYQALERTRDSDPYYDRFWNPARAGGAGWDIRRNSTTAMRHVPGGTGFMRAESMGTVVNPSVSLTLRNKVNAMNRAIDVQSNFARQGWDQSVPQQGVSEQERRAYYGRGTIPAAVREHAAAAGGTHRTQTQNVQSIIDTAFHGLETEATYQTRDISEQHGQARGHRNNNPGNIEDGAFARSQPGYVGPEPGQGRFARFDTHEHGVAAQEHLLLGSNRYFGNSQRSVSQIVNTYLGNGSDNSAESRANYIAYVAQHMGVDPNTPLDATHARDMARHMRNFETGDR